MKLLNLRLVKHRFFDRDVVGAVKDAGRKVLGRFGAYVRRTARQSLKVAKPKTPSELSKDEQDELALRFRLWAIGRLKDKPTPPLRPSRPGQPPHVRQRESLLKLILFAYDFREQSVTIGPHATGNRPGLVPSVLEYGGRVMGRKGRDVTIEPRPFMEPAFDQNLPHLRNWFKTV